jgi:hypothetical protein
MKLVIRVVGMDCNTGLESVLSSVESPQYSPDILESLVCESLSRALAQINETDLNSLRIWRPEISVRLSEPDDGTVVRPSLHLNRDTLRQLHDAGAEFDFDPYT